MSEPQPVVVLLRGINLAGRNRVSMPDLRAHLDDAGFDDARTLLQSGNVVVNSDIEHVSKLASMIEKVIEDGTGLDVRVTTRTRDEMAAIVAGNPFLGQGVDPTMVHTVFLTAVPEPGKVAGLDPDRSPPDRFSVAGRNIYLHYPGGSGRSKLNLDYFEKQLGVAGTARNWNTVTKLVEMLEE